MWLPIPTKILPILYILLAPAPTLYDIAAYPVARYIRDRTKNGKTLVQALCQVMHDNGEHDIEAAMGFGPAKNVRLPASPRARLSAAKELLRCAFGESTTRRASQPVGATLVVAHSNENPTHPVSSALAKLARDHTDNGAEAAELLIRIAENSREDGDWTAAHRVVAAKELLHRAYDLNYESVTWQHVEEYARATETYDEEEELERARYQAKISALLQEYREARKSGDEDAMEAAERKYLDFVKYGEEGNPDDPPAYPVHSEPTPSPVHGEPVEPPAERTAEAEEKNPYIYTPADPDPDIDFYYEPLTPEQQVIFDYEMNLESGDYAEGELTIRTPTPADYERYNQNLRRITEVAAAERVPVVPNPLASTLSHPAIRSP